MARPRSRGHPSLRDRLNVRSCRGLGECPRARNPGGERTMEQWALKRHLAANVEVAWELTMRYPSRSWRSNH